MNLREWASNSSEFVDSLPEADQAKGTQHKCLGLNWDTAADAMMTPAIRAIDQIIRTKREVLQAISMFFDPLGFHSPTLVLAKTLMQDIWRGQFDWDDHLSPELLSRWHDIATEMDKASMIKIPRFTGLTPCDTTKYELHVFCDASQIAYGTGAYLRKIDSGRASSDIIFSKTRVAPLKTVTIPRLELLATLLGARIIKFLKSQLPITLDEVCLHTDSSCVLGWLRSKKSQPVFVERRLTEIRQDPSVRFCYTPTEENPADLPSRGRPPAAHSHNMWWHGPSWLSDPYGSPPSFPGEDPPVTVSDSLPPTDTLLVEASSPQTPFNIDPERFSSWNRLIRVTAWTARFIDNVRALGQKQQDSTLTSAELQLAKFRWILAEQQNHYTDVRTALRDKKKRELIKRLDLFVTDNDIIRCGGRLKYADLKEDTKHPALLHKNSKVTRLIIQHAHVSAFHVGVNHTLSRLREEFWLPKGRNAVKSIVHQCIVCTRAEGGPFASPPMPPLPAERVNQSPSFTFCGVDYFGPMFVKVEAGENKKVWVLLFTCLATRAIHLELVADMSTEQFLLAFRRFVARRGCPSRIWSDNAPQFKHADKTLREVWKSIADDEDVQSFIATKGVQWTFIVEHAPWMGGYYERLIGIVKQALRKSLGKNRLTSNQLATLLCEVEAVINTRPLLYLDDEFRGQGGPLTPAHFLTLRSFIVFPHVDYDNDDPDICITTFLSRSWKQGQHLLQQFWSVFKSEYLHSLRDRPVSFPLRGGQVSAQPSVDSVVLIKDDDSPRGTWKMGRILRLHPGTDGVARSATIVLPSHKEIKRPISLLYPLELVHSAAADLPTEQPANRPAPSAETSSSPSIVRRPRRHAAQRCSELVRSLRDNDVL